MKCSYTYRYVEHTKKFIMLIECSYACRNPKTLETLDDFLFWFRYETFYYLFEFEVFRHEERERERHNFFLCWLFHLTPPRAAPHRKLLVWPRGAPKIDSLRPSPNLNQLFFFKFQNPQPIASGHDVIRVPGLIFYLEFLFWHLWLSHPPRARMNICNQCVHLTNPCPKPKGSQLN